METATRILNTPISRVFGGSQENSARVRLHGGGHSPSRTGLRFPNSLLTMKLTRNFVKFVRSVAILNANTRANSEVCSEIPYSAEQGNFAKEQGILHARTG